MAEVLFSKLKSIERENLLNESILDCIINEIENNHHYLFRSFIRLTIDLILLIIAMIFIMIRILKRNYFALFVIFLFYLFISFRNQIAIVFN
ncbi:hypothetical protein [Tanapox virus]|uniref:Uncharacterized protein 61R n=2 Tax=Tanapox virus TaxID=99000 RepID=A7XCI3_9POXV|nr:61R protein [Yaba-like disease virus]ABQ43536.1 hypothetical protein [Tanapox virus]ABQ43691.1 hypothetical protein [Tanapox virus]CAC21299.1 61R protein [Yaba-like disease virus]